MSNIMAKDRVKRLIVRRMMDAGWRIQTGASLEFLTEEYITELQHFSEDELNAAWNHVRNHSEDSERSWRYWPPPVQFKKAAMRAKIETRSDSNSDMAAYNRADEEARRYASNKVFQHTWIFNSPKMNEIKRFLINEARQQLLAGQNPNVTVPKQQWDEWQATAIEAAPVVIPQGMRGVG